MAGQLAGLTVLCIDNEPTVLDGMRTLLSGWGCRVLTADSAQAALTVLGQPRQTPDIVLADYHLDESTGLVAAAAITAAMGTSVPTVIITADYSPEMQRNVRELGYGLLRKPLKAAALRALMTQLTLQSAAAAE